MDRSRDRTRDETREKVVQAVTELAKGIKIVSLYPPGHPSLSQAIGKIITAIEDIPPPEGGIEIDVTKHALLYMQEPIPTGNKAVIDLNRELYHRRASRIILLPGQKKEEMVTFLGILNRDIQELQDQGGLEKVLLRRRVSRIWVNRVDYEGLTEMLKKEEEAEEAEEIQTPEDPFDLEDRPIEELSIEELLERLGTETDPALYRDLVITLSRELSQPIGEMRIEYAGRAVAIYAVHIERPPKNNPEIAQLARMGIQELLSDDLVAYFVRRLRERGERSRKEVEKILALFGDRAVRPLLSALSEETDLFLRKSIVDVVVTIGPPAIPGILENLQDRRWYVVRNMVTILGSLGSPDLAPHIVKVLAHPDLRVKKEAIKGLSKMPHPSALSALGELCFHPAEAIALTATAALSLKREEEAVRFLYRRVVQKKMFFPNYRLAHEAIDSLRAIDTDPALRTLEEILRLTAIFETQKFRDLKKHALQSISKMSGERPKEIVRRMKNAPEEYFRVEAERILKKTGW